MTGMPAVPESPAAVAVRGWQSGFAYELAATTSIGKATSTGKAMSTGRPIRPPGRPRPAETGSEGALSVRGDRQ